MIHDAFPSLPEGFYKVLFERIKLHHFTDNELTKAVNHVIDTCKYPTPTIAEFISYMRPDGVVEPVEHIPTQEEIEEKQALLAKADEDEARRRKEWEQILDKMDAAEKEANRDYFAEMEADEKKPRKVK